MESRSEPASVEEAYHKGGHQVSWALAALQGGGRDGSGLVGLLSSGSTRLGRSIQ